MKIHNHKWEYMDINGNLVIRHRKSDPIADGIYYRHCIVPGCDKKEAFYCKDWEELV